MSNILQIGYTTEGTTDIRFLGNVIQKTFENVVLRCNTEIDVYQPEFLKKEGTGFVNQIVSLTIKYSYFHVICIHCDSDSPTIDKRMQFNIDPAFSAVEDIEGNVCKNLVAVIPVQMTEAWMLADTKLLKEKIGTDKSDSELALPTKANQIESISDSKATIGNALRIAQSEQSRRRKKLQISDLYSPVSQELTIEKLQQLSSYNNFEQNVLAAIKKLNYME